MPPPASRPRLHHPLLPIRGDSAVGIYLGIDPGVSGGLASIATFSGVELKPLGGLTLHDTWDWFSLYAGRPHGHVFAAIEKVGGYVGREHARGSAMFTFGASFGALRMALVAAGIPFEEVPPQKWQKAFGIKKEPGEKQHLWKGRLRALAQKLFPHVKVTLATADSLLIAEYYRRSHQEARR